MVPPGLLPALPLVLGAVLGVYSDLTAGPLIWIPPLMCVLALAAWRKSASWLVLSALAVGMLAGGAALASAAREQALHGPLRDRLEHAVGGFLIDSLGPPGPHDPVPSRVILTEDASPGDGFVSLRAELVAIRFGETWEEVPGGVIVSVNGAAAAELVAQWRAGRLVEAPMTFRRPARYLNEGVADFERDLALDGVALLATVKSGLLVTVVERGSVVSELAAEVRAHVRRAVAAWIAPHDPRSAAIAAAVLIGDRSGLPRDTREALQAAGTYHVIAISGGNIAILAAGVTLVLLLFGIRGRPAAGVAVVALIGYAAVVTAGPSVWRATLMAVLYFSARLIDHRAAAWHTTMVAASLMVVLRPLDVRDPGFVLTFGATIALLEGARAGASLLPRHRALSWITASLVASFAVEVALLPVSATLFSRVTGAGLLLNLIAVPLMGVVQIAALLTTAMSALTVIAAPSGWVAHLAAQAIVGSADLVTLAPWATARVPAPGAIVIGVYYSALGMVLASSTRRVRLIAATVLLGAALVVTGVADPVRILPRHVGERLRLTMFDVGQGEAMLLETPEGHRLLIDAGGQPFGGGIDIGARVLAPALWARGRSLDALLVTHGDPDHVGGALAAFTHFTPRGLWLGVPVPGHVPTRELLDVAARRAVSLDLRRSGEVLRLGEVRLRVLHPPEPDWERRRTRNDDSVVLEVVFRDVALLLTGDISEEVERGLVGRLTPARTRVLKVAHHGSRTSSSRELLDGWRPQIALISAGRGNTFGHPAPEVLARLESIGATVLRTDRDGQITVETDGGGVEYETYLGQRSRGKGQR